MHETCAGPEEKSCRRGVACAQKCVQGRGGERERERKERQREEWQTHTETEHACT